MKQIKFILSILIFVSFISNSYARDLWSDEEPILDVSNIGKEDVWLTPEEAYTEGDGTAQDGVGDEPMVRQPPALDLPDVSPESPPPETPSLGEQIGSFFSGILSGIAGWFKEPVTVVKPEATVIPEETVTIVTVLRPEPTVESGDKTNKDAAKATTEDYSKSPVQVFLPKDRDGSAAIEGTKFELGVRLEPLPYHLTGERETIFVSGDYLENNTVEVGTNDAAVTQGGKIVTGGNVCVTATIWEPETKTAFIGHFSGSNYVDKGFSVIDSAMQDRGIAPDAKFEISIIGGRSTDSSGRLDLQSGGAYGAIKLALEARGWNNIFYEDVGNKGEELRSWHFIFDAADGKAYNFLTASEIFGYSRERDYNSRPTEKQLVELFRDFYEKDPVGLALKEKGYFKNLEEFREATGLDEQTFDKKIIQPLKKAGRVN